MFGALLTVGTGAVDAGTIMETALTSASSQAYTVLGLAIPVVAGVVAVSAAANLGFKWLRKIGSN